MTRLIAAAALLTLAFGAAPKTAQPPQPPQPPTPVPAVLQAYKLVTAERLLHPEDGDWLMVRRTYDGWGYSPLDQISPAWLGSGRCGYSRPE